VNIRAKLNVSFSIIIIAAICTFALITYYSVEEILRENRDAVFISKINNISARIFSTTEKLALQPIALYRANDDYKHIIEEFNVWMDNDKRVIKEFIAKYMQTSNAISSISIISKDGAMVLENGQYNGPLSDEFKTAIGIAENDTCPCTTAVFGDSYNLYLAYPFAGQRSKFIKGAVVFQVPHTSVTELIRHDPDMNKSLFFITHQGKPLHIREDVKDVKFAGLNISEFIDRVESQRKGNKGFSPRMEYESFIIFSASAMPLEWTVSYIVPPELYFEGLVQLRERIIIALAIIIMLAIDTIFVIAYKISKPLTSLSRASRDMVFENYNTPLEFVHKKDEVGELAGNFEAMRQTVRVLTTTDALTSILNRRYFMINLEKEFERAKRSGDNLACLMIDIDDFKAINDTLGHQCGDEVIKTLCSLMTEMIRTYDILARYGGEEFIIALPGINVRDAWKFAERLRARTEDMNIQFESQILTITISIGVASIINLATDTPYLLIKRADEALLKAKKAGKNRTVIYENKVCSS
jgi:diguanylate cyclase (GGDEF)-like protein